MSISEVDPKSEVNKPTVKRSMGWDLPLNKSDIGHKVAARGTLRLDHVLLSSLV